MAKEQAHRLIPFLAILVMAALPGCQSQPKKAGPDLTGSKKGVVVKITGEDGQEVKPDKKVEWAMLQSLARTTLKAGDTKHTEDILDRMLAAAGEKPERWQAIAQVVAGLPHERASVWLKKVQKVAENAENPEIPLTLSQLAAAMGDNNTGLKLAQRAVQLDNTNPKSRFWHARLLELNKNTLQAQAEYQWLANHYPEESDYQEALANILRQQGQLEQAEAIYARLPQDREILFKRLLLAMQQKHQDQALALFSQLKELPVDSGLTPEKQDKQWYLQGEAAWLLGLDQDALKAYSHIRGGDQYVPARFRLATLLDKQGDDARALEILRRLENYDQETATQAAIYRATILNNANRGNEAFAVLDQALRYQPENTDLLYARGLLHERHGNLAAMEKDLLAIIAIDPDNATALNALGYSLADHNIKLAEAATYLNKALQLEPENPAIIDSMGWLKYRLGQYDEAEKLLRKALKLSGNDPEIYLHLIQTLKARGHGREAAALLKQARSTFPQHDKLKALQ